MATTLFSFCNLSDPSLEPRAHYHVVVHAGAAPGYAEAELWRDRNHPEFVASFEVQQGGCDAATRRAKDALCLLHYDLNLVAESSGFWVSAN